jgi:type II secretory pathway pseudopilin PulG
VRARLRRSAEQGETLLELVVAIAILGVCVVAIGAGVALSVRLSAIHRGQSTADTFLHNYAEAIQSGYAKCSGTSPPNYVTGLATPTGFNTPTATVRFWDATQQSFNYQGSTNCPSADPGLQQVTLNLTSGNGYVSESLVVTVRQL